VVATFSTRGATATRDKWLDGNWTVVFKKTSKLVADDHASWAGLDLVKVATTNSS
jgi:hypothetical protein